MQIVWYLVIAAAVIGLQGGLFRLRGLKRIGYSRYFSTGACTEGDEVELVEQVVNRSWIPLPWLRLEARMHASLRFQRQASLEVSEGSEYQHHLSLFSMAPFSRITRKHKVRGMKRGIYALETMTMSTGDVLGTYQTSRQFDVEAELVVYPRAPEWDRAELPSHSWQGDIVVKRWIMEDPFMIAGVREYRPGDPLKGINWKATARAGKMLVHHHDFTSDHRLMVFVNTEADENMWGKVTDPELVEREIHRAAAVAEYALDQGIEVGYACNGHAYRQSERVPVRVDPGAGQTHREAVLYAMAATVISRSVPFEQLLERDVEEGRSGGDYVLITPFVSERIQAQIEALQDLGNAVTVMSIADPDSWGSDNDADRAWRSRRPGGVAGGVATGAGAADAGGANGEIEASGANGAGDAGASSRLAGRGEFKRPDVPHAKDDSRGSSQPGEREVRHA